MCLLSFKMNNQDLDEVMELDHRQLYKKCTEKDHKSFYEFQDWIEKEVKKLKFTRIYENNKKKLDKKKQQRNLNGIKYFGEV